MHERIQPGLHGAASVADASARGVIVLEHAKSVGSPVFGASDVFWGRGKRIPKLRSGKVFKDEVPLAFRSGLEVRQSRLVVERGWFCHGLRYTQYNKETKAYDYLGTFPALAAPVRNVNNELVTLHRIYLTEEGLKAPVPEVKKMMSQFRDLHGSAIRLFPLEDDTLGIAEGIETACAVRTISYMPMWAGVFATMLEQVEIPPQIKRVVIWADRDVSNRGIEAANALAERLEKLGLKVEVYLPPCAIPDGKKGVDWLDVLNQLGANGFPPKWRAWRPWHTLEPLKAYAAA